LVPGEECAVRLGRDEGRRARVRVGRSEVCILNEGWWCK
jgi:hypothetical protein